MEYINRFYWLIALCLIISTGANASVNPKPFVIPELKEWKGSDGAFVPTEATKIVYAANNPELERIARIFAQDYQTMFGRSLEVVQGKGAAGDFIFSLRTDKKLGKEGYTIRVTDRVALSAPENIGVYWGTRTLLQIAEQSENHQLPKGTLRDYPDYPLRGFMIDCGRKFIPLSYLQDYVKTMSYYKMNTFQIHLNDNGFKQYFEHDWSKTYAAFRLECDTYPGLTARDGHYTKKEFVDLQKLAEQSYVEIIPEIDIPAHSLAFSHYKPELGSKEYGMDHLDLFNPEVYTFFDALFKEYLEGEEPVFRGNKVHVGTDEYSNAKKEVVEKFRAFTDHYIRYIESFGKQACVWGALTHAKGDTPVKSENVIMNAWYNGYADPKEMIKQGYHLISIPDGLVYIVPQAGYYYDYLNTKSLYEKWTPAQIGKAVFEEKDPNILGGMFAVWNDRVGNGISQQDVHIRTFPAMQVMSEKLWKGENTRNIPFETFETWCRTTPEAPGVNLQASIDDRKDLTLSGQEIILQGNDSVLTSIPEIGYPYSVEFEIYADPKPNIDAVLFKGPHSVFTANWQNTGKFAFSRDGYEFIFHSYRLPVEKWTKVRVEGDAKGTSLYINGELQERLEGRIGVVYNQKSLRKDSIWYQETLIFPLKQIGDKLLGFKGRIRNVICTPLNEKRYSL